MLAQATKCNAETETQVALPPESPASFSKANSENLFDIHAMCEQEHLWEMVLFLL